VQLTYEAVRELQLLAGQLQGLNGQHISTAQARSKVFELSETDRLTHLIKTTGENLNNLYVSDASDSQAFVFKADGKFSLVKDFEYLFKRSLVCNVVFTKVYEKYIIDILSTYYDEIKVFLDLSDPLKKVKSKFIIQCRLYCSEAVR
jgi:hypothetical protein